MRALALGISILSMAALAQAAQAQCGCSGAAYYAPPMPSPMVNRPMHPPGSIAFVNRLATPINRGTYQLTYAVHLTDGRILLTDFLPKGYSATGTEYQTGGRKVAARVGEQGRVIVNDPQTNEPIATF